MKILFVNLSPLRFDVSTPEKEPLGGTESCVAYLATELAKTNEVWLLANTQATVSRSVRHLDINAHFEPSFFATQRFDVIVVVSAVAAVPTFRRLSPSSKIILWSHMAPDQAALRALAQADVVRALDVVVYVSEWQRRQTEGRFGISVRSHVIGNGLTPSFENLFSDRDELLAAKELRAAYTSTPFRGLEILLDAHARLAVPVDLDVYSSMQVYRGDETPFQALYQRAQSNPRVHYHGSVSQVALAAALRRVSFLSYPCTFAETYCIAALEAMAAGATVVATDLGALSSTTMGYGQLMPVVGTSASQMAATYAGFLGASIERVQISRQEWAEKMLEQVQLVNRECSWRRRAAQWQELLLTFQAIP